MRPRNSSFFTMTMLFVSCVNTAARQLGFNEVVASGIHGLDEHWNGNGRPERLRGAAIPLGARIALLSQVVDVFHTIGGPARAKQEVQERRGTWFDPAVVAAFEAASAKSGFWEGVAAQDIEARVRALEPESRAVSVDEDRLDAIATARCCMTLANSASAIPCSISPVA